jgi:hypothetical protein
MSIVLDSVSIRGLRATHFEQLQIYLEWAEEEGTYYGNQEQFSKRHEEIKKWLGLLCRKARDSDYIIPKT